MSTQLAIAGNRSPGAADDAFGRLPPYSQDAEAATIGSVMLDREAWENCAALVDADSFFTADHSLVWNVVTSLYRAKKPVDAVLVREELIRRGQLEEIGGTKELARMLDSVPSSAHGLHYAGIVAEKAKLRSIISAANEALRDVYGGEPAEAIATRLEKTAAALRDSGRIDSIQQVGAIARQVLDGKRAGNVTRLRTGLRELDDLCVGGLPIGLTTMIAGKPSMGKSQLGKQIARNIAEGIEGWQRPVPVGIVTIEETGPKIATNYMAAIGQVVNSRIIQNTLEADEWGRLDAAGDALLDLPVYIDDAQRRLSDIQRVARRLVRKHGCGVIVVDHIHLIDGETDANREQELSGISSGLKTLWKELNVAGVELLQMNRGSDREAIPELDHLRGSGSLEADGDLIMQLHRQDYFNWKKDPRNFQPDHRLCVYVNKNKDGPTGKVDLWFDGDHQQIVDWPVDASMFD